MSTAIRPSACPGLLRIVPALDGGICRIKLAGGAISATQALAVADAAQAYAGGVIEATNRANLQIRGIGAEHQALIAKLLAAGLGPTSAAGDDVRNLMLSPSAGIDPLRLLDTRPLAGQILETLQSHPRFHELSAKFAVQLDGGEALAMLEHHHDLWLAALERDGQLLLAFGLAGCPVDKPVAAVPLEQGHELLVAVLELFLEQALPEQTRMRHLLAQMPVSDFVALLDQRLSRPLLNIDGWQRPAAAEGLHLGTYPQSDSGRVYVGAVTPLGRLDPDMLKGVAQLAQRYGDASLRFTPWQSLLLPFIALADAPAVTAQLSQLGLLCSPGQALAHLIACTGSNGCGKALAETKGDAVRLAALLQRHGRCLDVHLSACSRSCAAAHVAAATLLAVAPGRYDVYFRDAAQPGFGTLHARNLSIEAAEAVLEARPRSHLDD
ncbi:precorrin-3B synthase [Pseudomonas sp. Fl4BN1]|uniref:precorrin-3B synthase n=1 Tax=Pseudomonas sp. Fl4BN1 TaxID=2697651 RepID=UPI001377C58A|nr:precorrin-3B synthase [Pseudomonas sp. Fl4BN1]NBF10606.1 precorrin-3B synthase [Pseudomonas sp. Fl4BN1]